MDAIIPITIMAVLIVLNALFVAAEFAIIGAPRVAVQRRAEGGSRVAATVARIQDDPRLQDRFIATAQLGITGVSLALGMYGEHLLAEWIAGWIEGVGLPRWIAAHTLATIGAVAILTYFHVVIGEMVPKGVALQRPIRTALWITPSIRIFQWATYPLVVALNSLGNAVLRAFGVRRSEGGEEQFRTAEEIETIVRESHAGGLLRRTSAEVVQELIDFGDLSAGEVMVPRVRTVAIRGGSAPEAIRAAIRDTPFTRYPVIGQDLDHITGMVHVKDLLRLLAENRPLAPADVRPVAYLPESASLERVMGGMREAGSQLAVVMDEWGGTAGIVTIEDLFEEVIGPIDEEQSDFPEIRSAAEGLRVEGVARLEDVGERLGVALHHPEVDTVSGLVLALLERPPAVGDAVEYEEVRFRVTAVREHGVGECVVERVEGGATEQAGSGALVL